MNYEIRVEGVLDQCWSAWFDVPPLTSERDGVTVIAGTVTDQAALHSLLTKIRDLGVPLISVRRIGPHPAEGGGDGRGYNTTLIQVEDGSAVRAVIEGVYAAWADNDADAFVASYAEEATAVRPGTYLQNEEEIRASGGCLRRPAEGLHGHPRGAEHPVPRCRHGHRDQPKRRPPGGPDRTCCRELGARHLGARQARRDVARRDLPQLPNERGLSRTRRSKTMASKQSEAVKDVWTSWTEAAVDVPPRRTLTRHTNPTEDGKETEMIRLSVFYPATDGATFDHDYYREKHVPLVVQSWGLDGAEIDRGVNGPYVAAVHFRFDSVDALNAARASPGTAAVLADVANYTTIQPVLQTSEIVD